ncbi:hypothetical protein [Paenibacillus thalictri]|uniref:PilZ domain-containing protein n=1 Tax=Paenibacillus thalictri TaxID=2527873 RepID=A0A4Q9DK58_9BACL|nr:hypothetical protein [Paenibacillus thalictri]TBL75106.1 hypothetical protein EYB31_24155 [Paenibacillus thalictri]
MQEIQLLHNGKKCRAGLLREDAEWMEVILYQPALTKFQCEDILTVSGFNRNQKMRVIHADRGKVLLAAANSDLFKLYAPERNGELLAEYDSEAVTYTSYKLNAFATLTRERTIFPMRVVDVSPLGIGFVNNDINMEFNTLYNASISLGPAVITPTVTISYAHFMEKSIRYCAAIQWITDQDLRRLRYFIASRTKQLHAM